MNTKRCSGIDTQRSVPRRPRLVEAFRAFLAEGYPGADFNIAYVGYFESAGDLGRHLLKQADLDSESAHGSRLHEYLANDYWQFHGHWFCRY